MATRKDEYSDKIRLCTGSWLSNNKGEEPYPYAWGDDCSVSDGHGSIHKLYFFTLKNGHHFNDGPKPQGYIYPDEICPIDVFHAKGFPARGERLTDINGNENEWYRRFRYRGNGTLQHMKGSEIWVYDAEFSSIDVDFEDDDKTPDDENTDPWDRKPWNVSLDFPETVKPFRYAYQGNKKFYEDNGVRRPYRPVINKAGDRIMVETTKWDLQLSFTYALKPRNDIDITTIRNAQGSINESAITLCGLRIPAGMGRIIAMRPQLIDETADDSGNLVKSHWEISATVQILTDEDDNFNAKLSNTGNRALFNNDAKVTSTGVVTGNTYYEGCKLYKSPIYQWWTFSSTQGQTDARSTVQFGSKKLLVKAQKAYNDSLKEKFGPFSYEEVQDIPLTEHGMVDTDAMNEFSSRFGKYVVLEFPEWKVKNWNTNSIFKQVSGRGGKIKW